MKYLYILKVGETFSQTKLHYGDFDNWIAKSLRKSKIKTIDMLQNKRLPNLQSAKGFIITGSHAMVTDEEPWSLKLEKYIQKIAKTNIPLLGICYGHQLIAKALGGKSDFNKNGKEIGVVKINQTIYHNDPIMKNIPLKFYTFETHYQTIIKLPKNANVLAKNRKDNTQTVRFAQNIWGVQFHPEFDKIIMKEYISHQKDALQHLDFDVDRLIYKLRSADISKKILINFEKNLSFYN